MSANFEAGVTRIGDRAHVWVSDEVSYSLHKLDDIAGMRPDEYATAARALDTMATSLFNKTPNTLTWITNSGSEWDGLAARNYRENFYKIVPPSIGNHAYSRSVDQRHPGRQGGDRHRAAERHEPRREGVQTVKLALDAQADENSIIRRRCSSA